MLTAKRLKKTLVHFFQIVMKIKQTLNVFFASVCIKPMKGSGTP